nr:MAG TPA: hypothetical protein [Caudoviricetes sp.]
MSPYSPAYIITIKVSGVRGWIIFIHHLCVTLPYRLSQSV